MKCQKDPQYFDNLSSFSQVSKPVKYIDIIDSVMLTAFALPKFRQVRMSSLCQRIEYGSCGVGVKWLCSFESKLT